MYLMHFNPYGTTQKDDDTAISPTNALFIRVQLTIDQLKSYDVALVGQSTSFIFPRDQHIAVTAVCWNYCTHVLRWT